MAEIDDDLVPQDGLTNSTVRFAGLDAIENGGGSGTGIKHSPRKPAWSSELKRRAEREKLFPTFSGADLASPCGFFVLMLPPMRVRH
jgi:hypothetical protein